MTEERQKPGRAFWLKPLIIAGVVLGVAGCGVRPLSVEEPTPVPPDRILRTDSDDSRRREKARAILRGLRHAAPEGEQDTETEKEKVPGFFKVLRFFWIGKGSDPPGEAADAKRRELFRMMKERIDSEEELNWGERLKRMEIHRLILLDDGAFPLKEEDLQQELEEE